MLNGIFAETQPNLTGGRTLPPAFQAWVLTAITVLALYVSYRLTIPFLPSLTWALAFAIVGLPLQRRLASRIRSPNLAAALSVLLVACAVILPTIFVGERLLRQLVAGTQMLLAEETAGQWREALRSAPRATAALSWIFEHANVQSTLQEAAGRLPSMLQGSVLAVAQLLIALFCLFFFWRDERLLLGHIRSWLPLNDGEVRRLAVRITDTVHASVLGRVATACLQGMMGGFMFWLVGLPAPIVWTVVMSVLAMAPAILGAFVIWVPAAVYLAVIGCYGRALTLFMWGLLVVSLIDNLIYPFLVGPRMQLHPLVTFIALLGGVSLFGASGIVLGPLVFAVTLGLVEIWRERNNKTS